MGSDADHSLKGAFPVAGRIIRNFFRNDLLLPEVWPSPAQAIRK
jgi:hypothetical protein